MQEELDYEQKRKKKMRKNRSEGRRREVEMEGNAMKKQDLISRKNTRRLRMSK